MIDLPPPEAFWVPPRPAIIRPADPALLRPSKGTFPHPFWVPIPAAGGAVVSATLVAEGLFSSQNNSVSVSVGSATNRSFHVVTIGGNDTSAIAISTLTLESNAGTNRVSTSTNNRAFAWLYTVDSVTSGTTATLVVNFDGPPNGMGYQVYAVYNAVGTSTPNSTNSNTNGSGNTVSTTLTVSADELVIANAGWTEASNFLAGSSASRVFGTGGIKTLGADSTGANTTWTNDLSGFEDSDQIQAQTAVSRIVICAAGWD